MPPTPKKVRMTSLIEKIVREAIAVSDGHPARPFLRQARLLAGAVLSLRKENRRLTSSNAQLRLQLEEATRKRAEAIVELAACQLREVRAGAQEVSDRRQLSAEATRNLCNLPTHKFPRGYSGL